MSGARRAPDREHMLAEAHIEGADVEAIFTDGPTATVHLSY